ncbi:MAG: alcohol dehydrogenase catalytic domain-containing protein, partial [Bacteroidales bacterium]|nr:alcohol dehydrogenase catalytic domain-containing protein [Bacteroidales bacterium]
MKAITLPSYQGNIIRALRSLEIQEVELPEPEPDEVLIEIEAAPANPSDLAFIQGGYNIRKALPAIPGFEGTGKVIRTGSTTEAQKLNGKRVSFFSQSDRGGSWATHIPVKAIDCIEIGNDLPPEQAACFSVNPFTAYAMAELALEHKSKAIIQNAAAGQL